MGDGGGGGGSGDESAWEGVVAGGGVNVASCCTTQLVMPHLLKKSASPAAAKLAWLSSCGSEALLMAPPPMVLHRATSASQSPASTTNVAGVGMLPFLLAPVTTPASPTPSTTTWLGCTLQNRESMTRMSSPGSQVLSTGGLPWGLSTLTLKARPASRTCTATAKGAALWAAEGPGGGVGVSLMGREPSL